MTTQQHIDTLIQTADRLADELRLMTHGSNDDIDPVIRRVLTLQEQSLTTATPILELTMAAGQVHDLVMLAAEVAAPVAAASLLYALGAAFSALIAFQAALTADAHSFGIRTTSDAYGNDYHQPATFVAAVTTAVNLAYTGYAARLEDRGDREVTLFIGMPTLEREGSPFDTLSFDDLPDAIRAVHLPFDTLVTQAQDLLVQAIDLRPDHIAGNDIHDVIDALNTLSGTSDCSVNSSEMHHE